MCLQSTLTLECAEAHPRVDPLGAQNAGAVLC